MGLFNNLFSSNIDPIKELESLEKSQKLLDERFEKKQISNETYKQKSLSNMYKREKLEKRIKKNNI